MGNFGAKVEQALVDTALGVWDDLGALKGTGRGEGHMEGTREGWRALPVRPALQGRAVLPSSATLVPRTARHASSDVFSSSTFGDRGSV